MMTTNVCRASHIHAETIAATGACGAIIGIVSLLSLIVTDSCPSRSHMDVSDFVLYNSACVYQTSAQQNIIDPAPNELYRDDCNCHCHTLNVVTLELYLLCAFELNSEAHLGQIISLCSV